MADAKVSTKTKAPNTIKAKAEYFVPEYGVTVKAESPEAAAKLAKAQAEGSNTGDQMNGTLNG